MTEDYRAYALAGWIASELQQKDSALLWITEWGIWPSSENWHLYNSLRNHLSGDSRELHDAPGHIFLDTEAEELASVLQLCLLNGWGGYILTNSSVINAFFSHDEYIDFFGENEQALSTVRQRFLGE